MNLEYLYGKPLSKGILKKECADFIVKEKLPFEFSNQGEFVVVKIRKINANTIYVADKLAEYLGIDKKLVSYAGLKDRQAITEQYFCIHLPGKATPSFDNFKLDNIEVLQISRHHKKIRIGNLLGNNFEILLREVKQNNELTTRLEQIKKNGFPNYFTEQRFGIDGNNITQALLWAEGKIRPKDRKQKSFYISALRSYIFNQIVSERILQHKFEQIIEDDCCLLVGSHSWFKVDMNELDTLKQRMEINDIQIAATLIGENSFEQQLNNIESEIITKYFWIKPFCKEQRMEASKRAIKAIAQDFVWKFEDNGLRLEFFLNSGCYATALVRELIEMIDQ